MSNPLFVPNTRLRVQEEALDRYGVELTDWLLDRIMDDLGWVRPLIEIETLRRVLDHHIGQNGKKEG